MNRLALLLCLSACADPPPPVCALCTAGIPGPDSEVLVLVDSRYGGRIDAVELGFEDARGWRQTVQLDGRAVDAINDTRVASVLRPELEPFEHAEIRFHMGGRILVEPMRTW